MRVNENLALAKPGMTPKNPAPRKPAMHEK
jgi:hypothetical protein